MAIISTDRHIRRKPQQAARCSSGKKKQTTVCTAAQSADGILKHRFLPLYQAADKLPPKKQAERDFFKSLSTLAQKQAIEVMNVSDKPYPYNVLLAHWDAACKLGERLAEHELIIATDENKNTVLVSKETCDTGASLYYIPILPLYRLLQDKKQKRAAELLLSVFAYLYHVADVPYYRDEYTFAYTNYEILKEWMEEDCETDQEDLDKYKSDFNVAFHYGDVMQRKLFNKYHLKQFRERVEQYAPCSPFELDCLKTAKDTLDLYEQYPNHTIYKHIEVQETEDNDYEENQRIEIGEYVSFIADSTGNLYQTFSEMVNNDFNERPNMSIPVLKTVYDNTQLDKDDLEFERLFFSMLCDLCTILNDLP